MEDFDYIIVGAGTAGCVLANRLTVRADIRVLLVEAGGKDLNPWLHIPIGYGKLYGDPRFNWIYEVEPEPELNGRSGVFFQGKVLGGSSSVNGLVYVRGQREDYDQWRELGNLGWDYASVLPYFRKAEDFSGGPDDFHGAGGPMAVFDPPSGDKICEAFIAAAAQAGIPRNMDFNGATQEGAGYFHLSSRKGLRCSAVSGYLRPALHRPNLVVLTNTNVERLLFNGTSASGIEISHSGERRRVYARREMILSAGALGSPLILQRSGVGSGRLLQSHGIPVVRDLPQVGQNLRNHFNPWINYRCRKPITLNDQAGSIFGRIGMGLRYGLFRSGFMALGACYSGAFFRTDEHQERPDVQVHLFMCSTDNTGLKLDPFSGIKVTACQLRPESKGSVEIGGPNPGDPPRVHFNFLSTELDRKTLAAGLRRLRDIMRQPALNDYVGEETESYPEDPGSVDLQDHQNEVGGMTHHLASTCRMGVDEDSVVTPSLRVRGLDRLRVVDASIMPTLVSGNTMAAAIMIGEKGADMILGDSN